MALPLWKRAALVPFLLFALWLLTDNDTTESHRYHHLAVVTALQRHPPSLRVYRSLLEINLLLWGIAASLYIWKRTIGNKMIGHLLFQPADLDIWRDKDPRITGEYLPVDEEDFTPIDVDDILLLGKSVEESKEQESEQPRRPISDSDLWNAHYDSDGEISEEVPLIQFEPPEAEDVAAIAVDSLVLILVSLFLFTLSSAEGGRYVDGIDDVSAFRFVAMIAAPIFPLALFLGGMFAIVFPWKKRRDFWKIISFTIQAPMHRVTFRDGFIGDIITSSVRPSQDVAFTIFYLFSGLQGWWKQSYDLDHADLPLETNWMLHTFILPMCMVSPLWWRFLQNLRQVYESKKRWPYLGNALKYFVAAEVAMFGLFNPTHKQTFLWLASFVLATTYQIWWDVFMDWELLEIYDGYKIRLRATRIYSVPWMYWGILGVNVVLRFCWTLSFIPPHYLNRAGVLSNQFEGDLSHILNPTIASAEIIRRTLWGFLRVELEAIKVGQKEPRLKGAWSDPSRDNEIELQTMSMEGIKSMEMEPPRSKYAWISSDMYHMDNLQILGELCFYAATFTFLGFVAGAHRLTL